MVQYHIRKDTPLKFHKFYRYIAMPALAIYGIEKAITLYGEMTNNYYLIDIGYWLITAVLACLSFFFFFKWRPAAWYCTMSLIAIRLLFSVIVLISVLAVKGSTDNLGVGIGQIVNWLFWWVPVGIYYIKRKPLFFN